MGRACAALHSGRGCAAEVQAERGAAAGYTSKSSFPPKTSSMSASCWCLSCAGARPGGRGGARAAGRRGTARRQGARGCFAGGCTSRSCGCSPQPGHAAPRTLLMSTPSKNGFSGLSVRTCWGPSRASLLAPHGDATLAASPTGMGPLTALRAPHLSVEALYQSSHADLLVHVLAAAAGTGAPAAATRLMRGLRGAVRCCARGLELVCGVGVGRLHIVDLRSGAEHTGRTTLHADRTALAMPILCESQAGVRAQVSRMAYLERYAPPWVAVGYWARLLCCAFVVGGRADAQAMSHSGLGSPAWRLERLWRAVLRRRSGQWWEAE
jgi:hypothetical protein